MSSTLSNIESGRPVSNVTNAQPEPVPSCCTLICVAFGFLFVLGSFFALPVAEIIMAEKYRQDMSCPNDIISPYTWMLVEGIVGIFIYGLYGIVTALLLTDGQSSKVLGGLFCIPLWILTVFHFAWIIVGAIMFWRDCIDLETKSMNDFYWAVLIINLVSLYVSGNNNNNKKND